MIPRREGSRCDKVDRKHGSAFLTASGAGASGIDRLDIVHFLLKHGANLNFGDSREGEIALFVASRADHLDIMRLLVAYGADVNTPPSLPGVLRAGHLNIVRVLMEHGAVVHSKGEKTALLVASTAGHLDVVVRFLFDHGADVNVKASLGAVITLFAASRAGHLGVQRFLVEHGADASLRESKRDQTVASISRAVQPHTARFFGVHRHPR